MTAAAITARMPMVRYWRLRKASAPSRMASEITRISGFPVSADRTCLARKAATTNDSTLIARTSGRTIPTSMHSSSIHVGPGRIRDALRNGLVGGSEHPADAGDYPSCPARVKRTLAGRPSRRGVACRGAARHAPWRASPHHGLGLDRVMTGIVYDESLVPARLLGAVRQRDARRAATARRF